MGVLRQVFLLVVLSLIGAILLYAVTDEITYAQVSADEYSITFEQAVELGNVLWVDARSISEFNKESIEGAICLNEDNWNEQLPVLLDRWLPSVSIVVYCSSEQCNSSKAVVTRIINELGIERAYVLTGGWEYYKQWQKN